LCSKRSRGFGVGSRLSPDVRGAFGKLVKKGLAVTHIAQLFEPYIKFLKEYMQFFNMKEDFETFLMRLVYNEVERLHRDLGEFVHSKDSEHFIAGQDWYEKNPHVAITSDQPEDEDC
jgi:hypothetical protein